MKFPRTVYKIQHNVTNRIYIGSSAEVDKRINYHLTLLRSHSHPIEEMQKDFDEYGECFSISKIDEIRGEDEKHKEYEWMEEYKSYLREKGYNYKDNVFHAVINRREARAIKIKRIANLEEEIAAKKEELSYLKKQLKIDYSIYNKFCDGEYGSSFNSEIYPELQSFIVRMAILQVVTRLDGSQYISSPPKPKVQEMSPDEIAYCNDFLKELYPVIAKYAKIAIERNKEHRNETPKKDENIPI